MSKDDDVIEYSKFVPNYDNDCCNCSNNVTVDAVNETGEVVHGWDMCGVCTFGTAKALDSDEWNDL
jgi:hypothetical protein